MSHHESRFAAGDGLSLYEQWWLPAGEAKAVVAMVHGVSEHSGRYARLAQDLNRHGYAAYALGPSRSRPLRGSTGARPPLRPVSRRCRSSGWSAWPPGSRGNPCFCWAIAWAGPSWPCWASSGPHRPDGLILSAPAVVIGGRVFPMLRRMAWLASLVWPTLRLTRLGCRFISRDPAVVEAFRHDPLVFHGGFPVRTGD